MAKASPTLGELERAVMDELWHLDQDIWLTVRQVHERLSPPRDLAYTTVLTVLDRLSKKHFVTRRRVGRAWEYRAEESREQLTAQNLRTGMNGLDQDQRRSVLLHFLQDASTEDLQALRAGLDEVERRRG
jgi:predicted transcriptional regulator